MAMIAILTDKYSCFQRQFIDPIAARLKVQGFGVFVVAGDELQADLRSKQPSYDDANRIFSVTKGYDVAGFVLLTGCIGHNLKHSELDRFVQGFTHLPTVSLGVEVPSASSVRSENRLGMRQLMEHVTEDASRQKFVFIRGVKNDKDSIERENVFRDVLAERGIPVNEKLMLTGNYIAMDAHKELDAALSMYPNVDAVVAANDVMAAAAIQVLKKRRYRIPSDVIVTGFDDSVLAKDTSPPLTTVHQPINDQVVATVETLLSLIRDSGARQSVRPTQHFTGALKIRESSRANAMLSRLSGQVYSGNLNDAWNQFVINFIDDNASMIKGRHSDGFEFLLHMIRHQYSDQSCEFDDFFADLEKDVEFNRRDLVWWHGFEKILSAFTLQLSRSAVFSSYVPPLLELQMQLSSFTWSLKNNLQFDHEHSALLLTRLQAMLSKCQRMDDIRRVLSVYLGAYDISRAFLVQYNSIGSSVDCLARVVYIFRSDDLADTAFVEGEHSCFESRDILPHAQRGQLEIGTLVLNPLYVDDVQLGYLLIDSGNVNTLNYEYLSYALSHTLERCCAVRTDIPAKGRLG